MPAKNPRGTRQYRQAVANLKARGDANCFTCGKYISPDYPWPHPRAVTLGHLIAIEDGGDPYDPTNHAAQCISCNMGDGANRTNRKRLGKPTAERQSYRNEDWYEAYQIGKPMALEPIRAKRQANAKLTPAQVAEVRRLRSERVRVVDVAALFGVSVGTVSNVMTGKCYRTV